MKNFSWNYFSLSGQVESYLLYKGLEGTNGVEQTLDSNLEKDNVDDI
ncbi:YqzL family protein [Desulfuribacillus stibiiarsenatis]|nr:YqzL family protein [Desulfuribacillus stibiiarsenatis]